MAWRTSRSWTCDEIIGLNPSYDERGLLSIAFHPDYPADPACTRVYTAPLRDGAPDGYDHTNVIGI